METKKKLSAVEKFAYGIGAVGKDMEICPFYFRSSRYSCTLLFSFQVASSAEQSPAK